MEEKIMVEEEFTFRKFFDLLKRSAKRILIFAIIAAVIGIGLSVVVGILAIEEKVYSSTVEFTHKGIEKGLAPDGTALDYNSIKSPVVINAALSDMGYDDNAVSALSQRVEDALSVAPYVSESIANKIKADPSYEYVSTRYVISITSGSVSGLKKSGYAELLNKVVEEYRAFFKRTYKYEVEVVDTVGNSALQTIPDYYDLIAVYNAEFQSLRAILNALPESYSAVASKLNSRISILENYVASLENFILSNNVQKEGATVSLATNLNNRKTQCEIMSETYQAQISELSTTIENYNQLFESLVVDSNDKITITGVDASVYNNLVVKKESLIAAKATCDSEKRLYEQKSALISAEAGTAEHKQYVDQRFADIYGNYSETVAYFNEELSDYTDTYIMNSGVRVVNPASASSSFISWMAVIATFIVTVFVGIVTAVVVTAVKTKK